MVYLTITSMILDALEKIQNIESAADEKKERRDEKNTTDGSGQRDESVTLEPSLEDDSKDVTAEDRRHGELNQKSTRETKEIAVDFPSSVEEPSLLRPKLGSPISHGQAIGLSKKLKSYGLSPRNLDVLLRGARVYVTPSVTKTEPTSEYKALMARLRRQEEARSYERMINPLPSMETFAQRFPMSSAAHAFSSYQEPEDEDEVTYAEINRQMALIFNVLVSIVACAGAIWVIARWWSTPARLALSMCGSLLVGVAEVVVYGGYIRKVSEAKRKEKGVQEVKEVLGTWVVGGGEEDEERAEESVIIEETKGSDDIKARRRRKEIL